MATRYWVGGSGTWDTTSTTHWSATSGGAGGASVPTSADPVIFNASSGGGVVQVSGDVSCSTFNSTGFTGTIDCITNANSWISSYTGAFTIGSTESSNSSYKIYRRSATTGATTLTVGKGVTIYNYEIIGATTGTHAIVPNASFSLLTLRHEVSSGTLTMDFNALNTIVSGSSWYFNKPVLINGSDGNSPSFTGQASVSYVYIGSGCTSAYLGDKASWGTIDNYSASAGVPYLGAGVDTAHKTTVSTLNMYAGAITFSNSGFTTITYVNIYNTASVTLSYSDGQTTINNITLDGGTLKLGTTTYTNQPLRNLTISGSTAKTILYNSSTNCNFQITQTIDLSSYSNLTFSNAMTIYHTGTHIDATTATNWSNVTLRVQPTSKEFLILGTSLTVGTFDTSIGVNVGFGVSSFTMTQCNGTGNSESRRSLWYAYNRSTTTLTASTWASANYVDFYGIVIGGGGTLSPVAPGDCGRNSGITFASPVTRYFNSSATTKDWGSTASWSATSGGATGASIPLVHDTAIFDVNSLTGTCTLNYSRVPSTIIATTFPGIIDATSSTSRPILFKPFEVNQLSGYWYFGATNATATNLKILYPGSICYVDCKQINTDISDSVWQLSGDTTFNRLSLNAYKTLNTNNYNILTYTCVINGNIAGDFGTSTISSNNFSIYNTNSFNATNATFSPNDTGGLDAQLYLSYNTIGKYLIDDSYTLSKVSINPDSGTINELKSTRTSAYTLEFGSLGTGYTNLNIGKWSVSGSSGNLVSITSDSVGSQAQMTYTGSGKASGDYLNIKDSSVLPATTTWYAGTHSTNSGNNTGWSFTDPPPLSNGLFFGSNF